MKKMLNKGFNPSKCKTSLKMAISRLKLLRNKKEIQLTQLKRDVAQLLQTGQDQSARIRVEHVVREEKTIAAYDLLDIYCELVVARLPIIETQKNCPIDLKEAITSIIFASPRCSDIPELMDIRKHLTAKYGKEFATAAVELRPDCGVGRTLIEKLSANAPDGPTKVKILKGIAEEHKINWEPNWFKDNEPEPPTYVPNEPNTDKISKMHVEPQTFQAAPSFEPKHEIPSNIDLDAGSEVNDPKFAYSAARPLGTRTSGTEPETVESSRFSGGVENSSFGARQNWNMEFKDASDAAHAAAESAEMASMAARAAAELASRGKFMDHASAGSKFVQNEDSRVHVTNTDQGGFVDRFSTDNSSREIPSRSEHMQRNPSVNVKASGRMDETNFKREYHQADKHDRSNSSQQLNSPMKAMQKDGNQPYMGKRVVGEVNPKMDHKQSLERYDELQDDVEIEEHHDSLPEDSELWKSASSSRVALKYEHGRFSYSDLLRDDGSVENPFHEEAVKTRNQSSGLSENYGSEPSSDPPKFDDDLEEDYSDSIGRGNFYKEDLEEKEPSREYGFLSSVSQKDDVLAFSERRKYGFESHNHLFSEGDDERMHMEKESTTTPTNDAAPHFDDYVADEDSIQSPGRKSPAYSSPDEERSPKKWGISLSKRLYQPELTESFKNSPIYSQLEKPISLGDDLDGASSENDDEGKNSKIRERPFAKNILYSPKKPETEHKGPDEFDGSLYGRRGTSSIISEESTVEQRSEESLERDSGASISKKSGSGDLSTRQQSSGRTRTRSDAKSYDRQSISRLLEEAERLSSPRRSQLQATPDVIDDSQGIELNVESLSGGLKNKGSRRPPYIRGTCTYPSSFSPISTVDDAPRSEPSTLFSSEIKESPGQKESVSKKKTSSWQGTYFDPNDDDPTEDAQWKGSSSIQNLSDKKISDNLNQRSSPRGLQSYFDSEDVRSEEAAAKQTLPSKNRSGTVASRRTRATGQNNAAGTRTETRASSAMESVSEKVTSPSTSFAAGSSAKPKTKAVIQMESLEPRRREENKTRPSHLSKMSPGEEISAPPSVAGKQATSSKDGKSGAESTVDSPKTSISTKKTMLRESSDKKAGHVHPKLPDYDDLASHFLSLRKDRQ